MRFSWFAANAFLFAIAVPFAHANDSKSAAKSRSLVAVDRVRFLPAPKHENAMVGAKITGSNVSATDGFEVLAEIKEAPTAKEWTELKFTNSKPYRWVRYEGAPGSSGYISKLEFYAGEKKLDGVPSASFSLNKWQTVFNDDSNNGVAGWKPDGVYYCLDVGDKASSPRAIVAPAGGEMKQPATVTMKCQDPGAVIRYTLDGSVPTPTNGLVYSAPLTIDKTTTITAVSFSEGLAPSPPFDVIYLYEPIVRREMLHLGNSLTGNAIGKLELHLRTAGVIHTAQRHLMGGGITKTLWNTATTGVGDPKDEARWKELFTTTGSMAGASTYGLEQVQSAEREWKKTWEKLSNVSAVTFQPRDGNVAEEADYTIRWLKLIRSKFPEVQPWLYLEWVEMQRARLSDKGLVASSQMKTHYPALTWEESMAAMMLYGEEVQKTIIQQYPEGKRPRIIPVSVAMGLIHRRIEQGEFPRVQPGDFYPFLFSDRVHINPEGSYLVDCVWYAAMYGESPEGKLLPLRMKLTPAQAAAIQELAWEVVKNYPDCGLYEEGSAPVSDPEFVAASKVGEATPVALTSKTPGAFFRYTLDGTPPTRTNGYIFCGVISARPGMTVKAIAYKSGMADSSVTSIAMPAN